MFTFASPGRATLRPVSHSRISRLNLLRAAANVSGLILVSRVLGLAREVIVARIFGAGAEMDAFNVAFRLPNLLRRLFAEGAFTQAFVPILSDVRKREGEARTRDLLSHVASLLAAALLVVSLLGVLAAPALVWAVASGFADEPDKFALATAMTRWMFPYILFMSLVACAAGVLNTYERFAVPAATPTLLNIAFIACALWLAPHLAQPIWALVAAVLLGGAAQLAIQVPALAKIGMLPRWSGLRASARDPAVRRILLLMGPAVFSVSVAQIAIVINTNIASHLATGSVSWLSYADRLMEFPTALLGVAFGTVLLPSLSRAYAAEQADEYSRLLDWGLRLTCLLALPAAIGLGLSAEAMVAVLYQGGKFTARDVAQTAPALAGYAIGLLGLIAVKILAPAFYSRQDMKTPVTIGLASLAVTLAGNAALVPWLAHVGLTVSISLGALANAGLLLWVLRRRGIYRPRADWALFFAKLLLPLAALAALLWFANSRFDWVAMQSTPLLRVAWMSGTIGAAVAVYFGLLFALGFRPRDFLLRTK